METPLEKLTLHGDRRRRLLTTAAAGAIVPTWTATAQAQAIPEPRPVALRVVDGVYMVPGGVGEVDASNQGRVGNAGFIVGASGVLVIDTGTSYRQGQALLQLVRRTTQLPIRMVLVSQARQEFLFGATAFQEQGIPVLMHADAANLMRARCARCLETLQHVWGDELMRQTAVPIPDQTFVGDLWLPDWGRQVRVLDFGHASGPGTVAVWDVASGVLFAGGLVDHLRVPDVQDSKLPGWLAGLQALQGLPLRYVVGGHGKLGTVAAVRAAQDYLEGLQQRVAALLRAGTSLRHVAAAADLPTYRHWDQYAQMHPRNASVLFLRLEQDQLSTSEAEEGRP